MRTRLTLIPTLTRLADMIILARIPEGVIGILKEEKEKEGWRYLLMVL